MASLEGMTVTVTLTRGLRARMWLGVLLIRLGVWVTGAKCKVINPQ